MKIDTSFFCKASDLLVKKYVSNFGLSPILTYASMSGQATSMVGQKGPKLTKLPFPQVKAKAHPPEGAVLCSETHFLAHTKGCAPKSGLKRTRSRPHQTWSG